MFHYSGGKSNTSRAFGTGISIARLDATQLCEILYWLDNVTVDYYRRRCRPTAKVLDLRFAPGNMKAEGDWVLVLRVNEQCDVIGVVDIGKDVQANLDAHLTTNVIHDKVHCSAKQSRS